ncbi:MAG: Fur family transcriptional regulator [Candidatus Humimicrobiaceae bacterium]
MVNQESIFKDYLKSKGLKFTPERRLILEGILSFPGHFDVKRLYDKLHRKSKDISLATIYRSLPYLVNSGLVKGVMRCQNRIQYEMNFGYPHHDHLICINCGKVFEFKDNEIEILKDKVCKKFSFKPIEHSFEIRGCCKSCSSKVKKS